MHQGTLRRALAKARTGLSPLAIARAGGRRIIPPMIDRRHAIYVGHLGPIPLYLHWTFLFLLYMIFNRATGGGSHVDVQQVIIYAMVLLSAIVLHEMGHGLAAKAQGAFGVTITLWAFGGLCSSTRDSLPRRELIILAAGPLVSFVLAWAAWLAIKLLAVSAPQLLVEHGTREFLAYVDTQVPLAVWLSSAGTVLGAFLGLMQMVNLWLGIFNIMPIYPLDGGQITFHLMRLFTNDRRAANISLAIAVAGAITFLAWRSSMSGGFDMYLAGLLAFLLFNAFTALR